MPRFTVPLSLALVTHFDGAFVRDDHEQSLVSFLVYLNDGFEGGETVFPQIVRTIVPRAGMALLFQHRVLHEGAPVRSGVKYVLRSDLMYRAVDAGDA